VEFIETNKIKKKELKHIENDVEKDNLKKL
jgi:hypothetical protein